MAIDVTIIKLLLVGIDSVSKTLSLLFSQRPSILQLIFFVGE